MNKKEFWKWGAQCFHICASSFFEPPSCFVCKKLASNVSFFLVVSGSRVCGDLRPIHNSECLFHILDSQLKKRYIFIYTYHMSIYICV